MMHSGGGNLVLKAAKGGVFKVVKKKRVPRKKKEGPLTASQLRDILEEMNWPQTAFQDPQGQMLAAKLRELKKAMANEDKLPPHQFLANLSQINSEVDGLSRQYFTKGSESKEGEEAGAAPSPAPRAEETLKKKPLKTPEDSGYVGDLSPDPEIRFNRQKKRRSYEPTAGRTGRKEKTRKRLGYVSEEEDSDDDDYLTPSFVESDDDDSILKLFS